MYSFVLGIWLLMPSGATKLSSYGTLTSSTGSPSPLTSPTWPIALLKGVGLPSTIFLMIVLNMHLLLSSVTGSTRVFIGLSKKFHDSDGSKLGMATMFFDGIP